MKVKLFTIAQGNSSPSYQDEVHVSVEIPPKFLYTFDIPKRVITYGDSEPIGLRKHTERRWKYNSKLSLENMSSCYLEIND
jgi:hypothetical protein